MTERKIIIREKFDPVEGDSRQVLTLRSNGRILFIDLCEEARIPGEPTFREPTGRFFMSMPADKIDAFIAACKEVQHGEPEKRTPPLS